LNQSSRVIDPTGEPGGPVQGLSGRSLHALDRDLSKWGNNLVRKFHVLMRISQIYDSKNAVLLQFMKEVLQTINTLVESEGSLSFKILKDDLFLNEQRLRYSVDGFTSFKYLLSQWKKRVIGEVIFTEPLDEKDLREFIYALIDLKEGEKENAGLLTKRLVEQGISSILATRLEVVEEEEGTVTLHRRDRKEIARNVFFETIGTMKEAITRIKGKQHSDVRKLKRLAQKAVDLVMEDESILLGMATIKNYDEYTFNHSVNVSIYSLAMGRRLGFSRKMLTDLVITGLFHDIGKSKVPREILNKPGALDEEEWNLMRKHPLTGVEIVLNLKELGQINPRMVVGIFDHHLKDDLTGYPKLFKKRRISLFGRIIQISDSYDAMTTPRVYKKKPYTAEQALAIMLKERTNHFDPILLKIFIGIIGIYPIGSLVLLRTGGMGIVYKPHPDPEWADRPQVIVVERDGKGNVGERIVDLAETDEKGCFKQEIVKTLDPYKYHIDITQYLLG